MPETNVVDMFLSRNSDSEKALDQLISAYDEASPKLMKGDAASLTELCVLAVPAGPQEERFREMARRAIADAELMAAPSPDDVVFYREETQLPLSKLEQMSQEFQRIYRQMGTSEHFTPHSRTDVEWLELTPE
jgi:hypothetical protein